jgi:hypothetical protein
VRNVLSEKRTASGLSVFFCPVVQRYLIMAVVRIITDNLEKVFPFEYWNAQRVYPIRQMVILDPITVSKKTFEY